MNESLADHKPFWLLCNAALALLHVAGIILCISNGLAHPIAILWAIILAVHALELPLAFVLLRKNTFSPAMTTIMTLLFGFTWWVPARRGIFNG